MTSSYQWVSNQWVASWGPGRLDIFGVGRDQTAIFHNWWNGSWGSWDSLGGTYFLSPPAVVSIGHNRLDVFAVSPFGYEQSIVTRWWDGSNWGPPGEGDYMNLGGNFTSPPAVVSWGPNRLDIFGLGQDQGMYHKWWDGSNWGPSGWEPLGGVFTSPPAAVAWGPNRLDIFGLGQDQGMYHKYWDGSWGPSGWEPLGGVFTMP